MGLNIDIYWILFHELIPYVFLSLYLMIQLLSFENLLLILEHKLSTQLVTLILGSYDTAMMRVVTNKYLHGICYFVLLNYYS